MPNVFLDVFGQTGEPKTSKKTSQNRAGLHGLHWIESGGFRGILLWGVGGNCFRV